MDGTETFLRLALALAIGSLVGIERGRHTRDEGGGIRVAGVRTFALIGLLGGVAALLSQELDPWVLATTTLALGMLIVTAHFLYVREVKDLGITTEIAVLLVFLLGALAVLGDMALAAAGGVATMALLSAKRGLHRWVEDLRRLELIAAVELLVLSVVLLPVLPNRGFGPGEALNPYQLWWLVVLVAGTSFIGYFAMKHVGARSGLVLTALFGGLASSTALTISFARLGRTTPQTGPILAAGIALAIGIMFVRLVFIVGLVNAALVPHLLWPAGLALLASLVSAAVLGWEVKARAIGVDSELAMPNPSEVGMALKFGALLAAIVLLAHYAKEWLGEAGLYALAALSGLTDVDAISLSLARMSGDAITARVAISAILLAAVVNTLVKLAIVATLANRAMTWRIAGVTIAITLAAGLGLLLVGDTAS